MHGTCEFDDRNPQLGLRNMTTTPASLPECVTQMFPLSWSLTGSGVFSWSVFRFYRASLFQSGPMDGHHPYALDLLYMRNLSAQQIVQTSVEEMIRLRPSCQDESQAWGETLNEFIPDVGLGDRLVGVFEPGQGVSFFSGHQRLGQVKSDAFADAFGAIWLDEQTKSPSLRVALLGSTQAKPMAEQA